MIFCHCVKLLRLTFIFNLLEVHCNNPGEYYLCVSSKVHQRWEHGGGSDSGSGGNDTGVDYSQIDDGDVKIGGGCSALGGTGGVGMILLTVLGMTRRRRR